MTPDPAITPDTTPFFEDGTLLTFPKGLVGFPNLKVFKLFEPKDSYPLKFLQSEEAREVSGAFAGSGVMVIQGCSRSVHRSIQGLPEFHEPPR